MALPSVNVGRQCGKQIFAGSEIANNSDVHSKECHPATFYLEWNLHHLSENENCQVFRRFIKAPFLVRIAKLKAVVPYTVAENVGRPGSTCVRKAYNF